MRNPRIRREAFSIFSGSWLRLLPVTLTVSLLKHVGDLFSASVFPGIPSWLLSILPYLSSLLFSPVTFVGPFCIARQLWRGGSPGTGALLSPARRLPRVVLIVVTNWTPALCVLIPIRLMMRFAVPLVVLLAFCFLIGGIVVAFQFLLRLSLSYTVAALKLDFTAKQCIRASWKASRKNIARIFCHDFILNLPLLAITMLMNAVLPDFLFPMKLIVTIVLETLYAGYVWLGRFKLHEILLTESSAL